MKTCLSFLLICCSTCVFAEAAPTSVPAASPVEEKSPHTEISPKQAVVLGVVEGLTEYLPVSSTGHLILAAHAMDLSERSREPGPMGPKIIKNPAIDAYEVIIQLGAILAVISLYMSRIKQMGLGIIGKDPAGRRIFLLLIVAFLPAVFFGLLLHKPIKEHLFSPYTVAGALIVGGVVMLIIEPICKRRLKSRGGISALEKITYLQAMLIGLVQCLAMWPGTSRSMVTILAALCVGLTFVAAAEFSFLLALPTLSAATVYAAYADWNQLLHAAGLPAIIIGIVVSYGAAFVAVKLFVKWLTRHGMTPFAVYRILIGIFVLVYFIVDKN